ncbi:MAG: hypothetical protein ACI87C_000001, partial [Paraperlucidibaca sp.]
RQPARTSLTGGSTRENRNAGLINSAPDHSLTKK